MEEKFVMSMLVKNEAGVLTRVSSLFGRRNFNIDSLSVGETLDRAVSRITITAFGDEYVKRQIQLQLEKLHDVIVVKSMNACDCVTRELLLIKVNVAQGNRSEVMEAIAIFRAKVIDITTTSLTVEITGEHSKCNAFLEYLRPFGIVELCRTGVTAIARGSDILEITTKEDKEKEN
ncbi:MAG: acetolactate synthase small subunit [Clostridia bacterium]|nr:acetolactate synthase small subunit [Clostridia bacterium]